MKLSAIKKNPNNPREIRGEQFARLKKSVQDFPQMMALRPIIVDSEGVVLGGNMRLQALKALKFKEIPDEWVKRADELTDEQKREFIVKDNAGFGEWDWDALANEWSDLPLAEWGVNLPDEWLSNGHKEEDESKVPELIDRAAELQTKWGTELGQLWQIGKHRLLVGDCTEKANVARLCGDNRPSLMVTDPPYGVDYEPHWRDDIVGEFGQRAARGDGPRNDDIIDWSAAYQLFEGDVVYCWHAGRHASTVQASLEVSGFEVRSQIIWAKQHFAVSRGHYHWRHEPCWYAVRKGATANWIGDRTQTTLWEISSLNPAGRVEERVAHGTQKPIECMARPLRNHAGDVYDPFIGSGTTMIAAEQEGRICYGMEIEPKYCAVTLERLLNLGLTPSLQK